MDFPKGKVADLRHCARALPAGSSDDGHSGPPPLARIMAA